MEKLNELMVQVPQMKNLENSLQENLQQTNQFSISIYDGKIYDGKLTTECIINEVKKLKNAFPSLPKGFYDVLTDRIKELGFSDARLTDAVNNMIDTCIYPQPTIANLISWDKRIKLYNYQQIVELVNQYGVSVWDHYKAVKISARPSEPPR